MLERKFQTSARRTTSGTFGQHRLDHHITRDLIDQARPTRGLLVNILQLLFSEQLDPLASPLKALREVFTHFIQRIRLQLDDMHALFTVRQ